MRQKSFVRRSSHKLDCLKIFIVLVVTIQGTPIASPQHYADVARQIKAEEMLKYMNTSVDPCEDFYEYTCGNYGNYHIGSLNDFGSVGPLELLDRAMDEKTMLELQIDNATDTEWNKIVKNFYRSCTIAPDLDSVYPHRLKDLIAEIGQMPALVAGDSSLNLDFDWLEAIAKIASTTNEQIIIGAYIYPDFIDNTKNAGILAAPVLSLEQKAFYVNENMQKLSHIFIEPIVQKMHKYLGMDWKLANQTAKEIFAFEVLLAECLPDDKDNSKLLDKYVAMEIDELQAEYLEYWDTKKLFSTVFGLVPNVVYVQRNYTDSVKEVLKKTSNRVLANYIFYTYANYFMYSSAKTQEDMNRSCLKMAKTFFYKNLDNLMYRRLFTESMKDGIYSIWHDIKAAFEKVVASPRMDWINDETRRQTIEKLSHMAMQINSYENEDFAKDMQGMHVQAKDYVANVKSIYQHLGDLARAKANRPPEAIDTGYESTFTPLYHKLENKVYVPVSLLMPFQFWSDAYPQAYNFASLGFYLAHEVLHGFDDDGRLFDKNGNSHTWWDTKSMDEFSKRKECFVKQYANFTYNESPLGELDAQDENIADNGGVRLAYEAYLHWYANSMNEDQQLQMESLPGFKYTPRQLFFVSYGQLWCNNVDAVIQLIQKMVDTHMPDRFRVIGPLSNLEEFHKEFHCPKGSGMNPAIRCEIY